MRFASHPGYGHSLAILLAGWRGQPLVSHHRELVSTGQDWQRLHPELDKTEPVEVSE